MSAARLFMNTRHLRLPIIWPLICCALCQSFAFGQTKPQRARAPDFKPGQFEGVFYTDVPSLLRGALPSSERVVEQDLPSERGNPPSTSIDTSSGDSPSSSGQGLDAKDSWKQMISPVALEDLIKGSKARLDRMITTPAAFAGGGFQEARKEFSLQALLFAIIESYPDEVRWKSSAGVAREALSRVAANTKVGSRQVYDEAKKRLVDLSDLLNGSPLPGGAKSDIDWSKLIDRVPLMQLLEWSHQDNMSPYVASEQEFAAHKEELLRYSELIAVLGKISLASEMPDADDSDYQALAREMILQAQQVRSGSPGER